MGAALVKEIAVLFSEVRFGGAEAWQEIRVAHRF